MRALEACGIPVIPATSKTRAEMLAWREQAKNRHPLIVENGAAVVIPEGYFSVLPDQLASEDGYHVMPFVAPRAHWLELLAEAAPRFPGCWRSFTELGEEGASLPSTGLDPRERGAGIPARIRRTPGLAGVRVIPVPVPRVDARSWRHGSSSGGRFVHVSGRNATRAGRWTGLPGCTGGSPGRVQSPPLPSATATMTSPCCGPRTMHRGSSGPRSISPPTLAVSADGGAPVRIHLTGNKYGAEGLGRGGPCGTCRNTTRTGRFT